MILVFQNVSVNTGPQPTMNSVMTGFASGAVVVSAPFVGGLTLVNVGV